MELRNVISRTSEKNLDKKVTAKRRHSQDCTYSEEAKPEPNSEIGRRLNGIYGGKYGDWIRSYGVTPSWETQHDSVEIYIWHGYRPNPSSVWACMKSMFGPNNQTVNFWTHFIPCLMMMFRTYRIFTTLDDPTNVIYYPFWIHCFGCCYVMFVSSGAHMFNSLSAKGQEMGMCCDYSAISVQGITNVIAFELYVCPRSCFMQTDFYGLPYLVVSMFLGWTTNFLSCLSRHPKCPYFQILKSLPSMVCYVLITVPCIARFISTTSIFSTSNSANQSASCSFGSGEFPTAFLTHLCCFVMATFFNVCRLPEKRFPGTFDIIGHSHNFFHIFIALGLYTQNILVENVLHEVIQSQKDNNLTAEDMSISPWTTLYPIVTFLILSTSIVIKCSHILGCQLEQRRLSKKYN